MEEKERYIFIDLEEGIELIDTENKTALDDADKIKDTLNQQSKRIKELEKENRQLKQQLAITEKALELACDVLRDINYKTFNDADVNFEAMFEKQAKEMLENE